MAYDAAMMNLPSQIDNGGWGKKIHQHCLLEIQLMVNKIYLLQKIKYLAKHLLLNKDKL